MFIAASLVGIHGRLSAKNARVSSRLIPANGRLNANQNSAMEVRLRRVRAERAVLVDQPHDRGREHSSSAAAGISSRLIWRIPFPIVLRIPFASLACRHAG